MKSPTYNKLYIAALLMIGFVTDIISSRSFVIDYKHNQFLKDGHPFRYISGSLHYFRVPAVYWKDRMLKMKAAGLNSLQTYVEWNSHEPESGIYNFEGDNDITAFLKTAMEVDLLVILRPGPYICAERDMGGFPYWLLRIKPTITMRTSDSLYIKYVDRWFKVLLPLIRPYLYKNGGPIIAVQVENEYGQYYACDFGYMNHLRDLIRLYFGSDVPLFHTDIPQSAIYKCDNIDGTLVTADFGAETNVSEAFKTVRLFREHGPLIVTEYYTGWMDHWGEAHAIVSITEVCNTLDDILASNASVNMYMFHGGTNFGFTSGANAPFSPQPTSYDYAAPLSEAGDPTDFYFSISKVISKYVPLPPVPTPKPAEKLSLGPFKMHFIASLLDYIYLHDSVSFVISDYPKTFEELGLAYGFCAYLSMVNFTPTDPALLAVSGLHDRGYIFVDNEFRGILSRAVITSMPLNIKKNQTITILVESQGRINYGKENHDFKGLVSNVTINSVIMTNWTMYPIPLNNTKDLHELRTCKLNSQIWIPGFFSTSFILPKGLQQLDTFLDPTGWHKGVAFLNGFNLGRYWPIMGPQITLYVPGYLIQPYPFVNNLTFLELEESPCIAESGQSCTVKFIKTPYLNGSVPYNDNSHLNKKLN